MSLLIVMLSSENRPLNCKIQLPIKNSPVQINSGLPDLDFASGRPELTNQMCSQFNSLDYQPSTTVIYLPVI